MSVLNEPVLVLNRSWSPITVYTARKALTKLIDGKANVIDRDCTVHDFESWMQQPLRDDDLMIRTYMSGFRVPEVIVLESDKGFSKRKVMAYSARNIKKRDGHVCQYCGKKPSLSEQTIDHIVPRARGGGTSWLNCVLACTPCNFKKGDKLLSEAGMKLLSTPYEPRWSPVFRVAASKVKGSWKQFLPESATV